MASKIFTQSFVDGSTCVMRRSVNQGRPAKPKEYRMVRSNITTSRQAKQVIKNKARQMGLSFSAYLELAGILYTPELLIP